MLYPAVKEGLDGRVGPYRAGRRVAEEGGLEGAEGAAVPHPNRAAPLRSPPGRPHLAKLVRREEHQASSSMARNIDPRSRI
eukprot:8299453-Pyramimonas_sp.AAC.1